MIRTATSSFLVSLFVLSCAAPLARAGLPSAQEVLAEIGYTADEIGQIEAGKIVRRDVGGAHERDLAVGFAFRVPIAPAALVRELETGMLARVDPNTISRGDVSAGTLDDFAALRLEPDGERRAKRYASAKPGDDLNLSTEEIAAFNELGDSPSAAEAEAEIRRALLARVQSYREKGLDGVAPYDRGKGTRSVADDLRTALASARALKNHAPAAYAAMEQYPAGKPPGTKEGISWTQLKAHDVPTIVLTHGMFVPDGDAYLALQRQFYVSEGFNCEQAVAGFLPVEGGTLVVYSNHTSTDQVAGFGGGAKRSIGSKLMASELEGLFAKLQKPAR